jgi:peroxiredoxin (alkyl hydroperoxide reductase subunit C)
LNFPLGADVTHTVSKAYGIYDPRLGLAQRAVFIIDPDGIVQHEVIHNLNVSRTVDEALPILQGLQAGGLCTLDQVAGEQQLTLLGAVAQEIPPFW